MSQNATFAGTAGDLSVPHAEVERHPRELGTTGERRVLDLKSVTDARFLAGEGVLVIGKDTPDEVILLGIKEAVRLGKPFTVIPA